MENKTAYLDTLTRECDHFLSAQTIQYARSLQLNMAKLYLVHHINARLIVIST